MKKSCYKLTLHLCRIYQFFTKELGDSRESSREAESQPHPNSLIYNDGAANSPPSPYASLAFRGRRWQAPIGSPSTLADGCWVGLQSCGLLFVGWVDGTGSRDWKKIQFFLEKRIFL